jgi:hypothetical protein
MADTIYVVTKKFRDFAAEQVAENRNFLAGNGYLNTVLRVASVMENTLKEYEHGTETPVSVMPSEFFLRFSDNTELGTKVALEAMGS